MTPPAQLMASSSPSLRSFSDIARLSYSPKELAAHIRWLDYRRFALPKVGLDSVMSHLSNEFYRSNGAITSMAEVTLHGKKLYPVRTLGDHLFVRRTDAILRRALQVNRPDRHSEVRQLVEIIFSEPTFNVLRTDVSSFFESVSFERVINQLESDGFRNHSTIAHLRSIHAHLTERFGFHGLPRGLPISSTLADYVLRPIDRALASDHAILYYTRYVDDICIVHTKENLSLKSQLVELLKQHGLSLNPKKTSLLSYPHTEALDYLGYSIKLDGSREISIAKSKIAKAKRRIALTLRAFTSTAAPTAFQDLRDRLRFLSSVVELTVFSRSTPVYSGFRNVYKACSPNVIRAQLAELDSFLHGLINSPRYKLSQTIRSRMTPGQLHSIRRISFRSGYTNKVVARFSPDRIAILRDAWRYE